MQVFHQVNIFIHVFSGSVALLTGMIALVTKKGSRAHIKSGKYFLIAITIVIFTGLVGVIIFERNTFLLVITLLSGYTAFSGIRVLRHKIYVPVLLDYLAAMLVIAAAFYYLYYIRSIGMFWDPVIIYSTLGALALVTVYDLGRYFLSSKVLKKVYIYEHIYKMVSAFIAILSAFTGTVFANYQPYSQILPTIVGLAYILLACIYFPRRVDRSKVFK